MTSTVDESEALLRLAKTGNDSARGPLFERYRHYLHLLAQLHIGPHLRSKVDAADVVQETYLNAHRDFARFAGRSRGEFVQWLRRILAANLARTMRTFLGTRARDARLERDLVVELDKSSVILDRGLVARDSSPSHKAVRHEQALVLADALARLPENYRHVLILRHLEGLTFPQVAAEMERTIDSVKKLWTRALAQLRHALGEQP